MSEDPMACSNSRPAPEAGATPDSGQRRRRAYSSPLLIEWGSLVDLTRGGAGAAVDYDLISTKAV